jgi:hypothetical protein
MMRDMSSFGDEFLRRVGTEGEKEGEDRNGRRVGCVAGEVAATGVAATFGVDGGRAGHAFGETPRPRYILRSIASPQQCVPNPRYNLRSTSAPGDG